MDVIMDFISQALPFVIAGFIAAIVGTFLGSKRR